MPTKLLATVIVRTSLAMFSLSTQHSLLFFLVQKSFVQVVRAVELALGIPVPGQQQWRGPSGLVNATAAFTAVAASNLFTEQVRDVLMDAAPMIARIGSKLVIPALFDIKLGTNRDPLVTKFVFMYLIPSCMVIDLIFSFMDVTWQYNNPSNPADAAIGPQAYDNHLYFSFGVCYLAPPINTSRLT
jgi:glucan endo-1,6-beta-glucosidase